MSFLSAAIDWVERGWIPDLLTRAAIRRLCRQRLRDCGGRNCELDRESMESFLAAMRSGPVAPVPERANEQHYEVPADFFGAVLGPHRKYSCCLYPTGRESLAEAERLALEETIRHARLEDGQEILELGCGWGSLTLWMAEQYPQARITGVSNSASQRAHIEGECAKRGLKNVRILTCDMNVFAAEASRYDRVVSVEMFEHMANWPALLDRIRSWLRPDGRLFLHVFSHKSAPYRFDHGDDADRLTQ